MTRFVLRAVRSRQLFVDYLVERIPGLEIVWDQKQDAFETFRRALQHVGAEPAVHLEEDIVLTRDFCAKAEAVIALHPKHVIQFFSMRKADLAIGSRWDRDFQMNQCHYFPAGFGQALLAYYPGWAARKLRSMAVDLSDTAARTTALRKIQGYDEMMKEWFKVTKIDYWIHVPSLVDHRIARSAIDPRRSSKRQSLTFTDPWL